MTKRTSYRTRSQDVPGKAARRFYLRLALTGASCLALLSAGGVNACFAQTSMERGAIAGESVPDAQKLRETAARYEQMVREHPTSSELWSNLGAVRAMAGDCRAALPALEHARSLNAKLFTPWLFSGYCDLSLHRDAKALLELEKASRLNPDDANAWFLRSQAAGNVDKLDESLEAVVHALALARANAAGYYLAGQDSLDLAAQAYDRLQSDRGADAYYSLVLEGQRNAAQQVWALAIDRYQAAQKAAPDDPDVSFSLGSAYLEMGKYAEAEAAFGSCLQSSPGLKWARLRLALALAEQSKRSEALKAFQSVALGSLELPAEYQDYVAAAGLLGLDAEARAGVELGKKRFKDHEWPAWFDGLESQGATGTETRDRSIKLQGLTGVGLSVRFFLTSDQPNGNYVEGEFPSRPAYQRFRAAFLAEDWISAAQQALPLLEVSVEKPSARSAFILGEILQSLSYGFYQHLAREFPDSEPTMELAGRNFEAMGQQDKALEVYNTALRAAGPSPGLLRDIARVYWTQHEWDQALKALRSLAAMDPNDPTIFVNMGRIYSFQENLPSAEENFRRAVHLDPAMFEARLGLGQVLRRRNDAPDALKELQAAARIEPKNPRTHYEISQIYRKLGEKAQAAAEMQKFQRLESLAGSVATEKNRLLVPLD